MSRWRASGERASWGARQRQRLEDRIAVAWNALQDPFRRDGERGERSDRLVALTRTLWGRVLVLAVALEIAWLVLWWR